MLLNISQAEKTVVGIGLRLAYISTIRRLMAGLQKAQKQVPCCG